MNHLDTFRYGDHPVRTVSIDGEPWFVLGDLTKVLGLTRGAAQVSERLDDGVRRTYPIQDALGRVQNATVVSEPGMYEVVIRSDKSEAVAFRRWITAEVLPSIRKTGGYGTPPVKELTLAEKTLEVMAGLQQIVDAQKAENQKQQKQIEAARPLVARAVTYQASAKDQGRREFAREVCKWARDQKGLRLAQSDVHAFLGRKLHMFIMSETKDHGHATAEAEKRGLAVTEKDTTRDGYNWAAGRLTPKGQEYAWKRIVAHIEEFGTLNLKETAA